MGSRRERRRARLDREAIEEAERMGFDSERKPLKSEVAARSASDDEDDEDREANEDLSLKIIEKSLLLRAASLRTNGGGDETGVVSVEIRGNEDSGREENEVDLQGEKKIKKATKKKKKKTTKKTELAEQNGFVVEEDEVKQGTVEAVEAVEAVAEAAEPNPVESGDSNIVFRKLLRGPRYFDPPDSSWGMCYNCGEEGHRSVNCTSARRRKPCFVCGSLEHNVKQCTKGRDCFICEKGGHRAKDCPDKYKSISTNLKICLKCGDSGHDMFSCKNHYYNDDLKEICCYVCKKPGHLCCINYVDSCAKEVSCYRCGQLGHTGSSCTKSNGQIRGTESVTSCYKCGEGGHFARECTNSAKSCTRSNRETRNTESDSSCYKCGEGGHFARECPSSSKKKGKRNREPSTPTLKPHRDSKQSKGHKSAPHDLGKPHKKKKPEHGETGMTTPKKAKHRGGWITEDPGDHDYSYDRSRRSGWRSPATPSRSSHHHHHHYHHHHDVSTPHYSCHTHNGYRTPDFQVHSNGFYFQNGHSGSRFGNPSSSGGNGGVRNRRNYDWR